MAVPSLTRVVRAGSEPCDVLIDRSGPFGNPHRPENASLRARLDAIERFRGYFLRRVVEDEEFRRQVNALRGRVLGCHCAPKPCHGHVIAAYLDEGLLAISMPSPDVGGDSA